MIKNLSLIILLTFYIPGMAQKIDLFTPTQNLEGVNVSFSEAYHNGQKALKVVPKGVQSEAKFVKLNSINFKNGTIEIDVIGNRQKNAGRAARGFVGLAFRVNDDHSKFECFYIRPANGRSDDQLRRNHSVQYFSFPNFPWHKLRKDNPGKYETYADLEEGVWTKLKIIVSGNQCRTTYINRK